MAPLKVRGKAAFLSARVPAGGEELASRFLGTGEGARWELVRARHRSLTLRKKP